MVTLSDWKLFLCQAAAAIFCKICAVSILGNDFCLASVFIGGSSRKFGKKYCLPKLLNILEKQSGEIETFDAYFALLNYLCFLLIKLYRKTQ